MPRKIDMFHVIGCRRVCMCVRARAAADSDSVDGLRAGRARVGACASTGGRRRQRRRLADGDKRVRTALVYCVVYYSIPIREHCSSIFRVDAPSSSVQLQSDATASM